MRVGSIDLRGQYALTALCGASLCLAAFAPPGGPRLAYDLAALGFASTLSVPGESGGQSIPPIAPPPKKRGADWTLTVDAGVTADSNVTNGSNLESIPIFSDGRTLPVPLDPSLRRKAGLGKGVAVAAGLRLPFADDAALALGGEVYATGYQGERADDAGLLVAAGAEAGFSDGGKGMLQLLVFERWYGGITASAGYGVRGRYRQPAGDGRAVTLAIDARIFSSDYGEDFGGTQAAAYLSYEMVLAPDLSASIGGFVRREWLGEDAYSSLEAGLYGGISQYLGEDLVAGVSASVSRLGYDAPLLLLSPDARRDWRFSGTASLATRRPLLLGIYPSLAYNYNRNASSIGFYRAERHRLRLGLLKSF